MLIYHGSDMAVPKPQILPANRFLDFGEGFYTTFAYEQARRWALLVSKKKKSPGKIISVYEFEMDKAIKELKIRRFDSPDSGWLHFVTDCRSGKGMNHGYDVVMGPVANDNVYATIQLFETGLLSEAETLLRLKVEKIYNQILFHTGQVLKYCTYLRHEDAGEGISG